jgi:TPR repeat protein
LKYDTGDGLPHDPDQAARWYHLAAEAGEGRAASNLARLFAMGEGVERSDVQAFKWYSIAAELGVANAARYRERVARELDPPSRLYAGELAQNWLKAFRTRSPGRGH